MVYRMLEQRGYGDLRFSVLTLLYASTVLPGVLARLFSFALIDYLPLINPLLYIILFTVEAIGLRVLTGMGFRLAFKLTILSWVLSLIGLWVLVMGGEL
jgi:hypothetical protein